MVRLPSITEQGCTLLFQSIDMVRDTLNAAYGAMHRAGQLLASIAPILRGLRPGQTAVFRSSYEISGEEEIHEGETRTAPTAGGLVTIADICRKGQELITMCRETVENGTEPLPEEGHIQKERVQEDFNKLSTEKRRYQMSESC